MRHPRLGYKIAHMGQSERQSDGSAIDAANAAVAAHLRAERARANLKQSELAEMSGLSVNTILRLENGQRVMTLSQLFAITRALGVDPGHFVDSAQAAMRK